MLPPQVISREREREQERERPAEQEQGGEGEVPPVPERVPARLEPRPPPLQRIARTAISSERPEELPRPPTDIPIRRPGGQVDQGQAVPDQSGVRPTGADIGEEDDDFEDFLTTPRSRARQTALAEGTAAPEAAPVGEVAPVENLDERMGALRAGVPLEEFRRQNVERELGLAEPAAPVDESQPVAESGERRVTFQEPDRPTVEPDTELMAQAERQIAGTRSAQVDNEMADFARQLGAGRPGAATAEPDVLSAQQPTDEQRGLTTESRQSRLARVRADIASRQQAYNARVQANSDAAVANRTDTVRNTGQQIRRMPEATANDFSAYPRTGREGLQRGLSEDQPGVNRPFRSFDEFRRTFPDTPFTAPLSQGEVAMRFGTAPTRAASQTISKAISSDRASVGHFGRQSVRPVEARRMPNQSFNGAFESLPGSEELRPLVGQRTVREMAPVSAPMSESAATRVQPFQSVGESGAGAVGEAGAFGGLGGVGESSGFGGLGGGGIGGVVEAAAEL